MRLGEGNSQLLDSDDDWDFDLPVRARQSPASGLSISQKTSSPQTPQRDEKGNALRSYPDSSESYAANSSGRPRDFKQQLLDDFDSEDDFPVLPRPAQCTPKLDSKLDSELASTVDSEVDSTVDSTVDSKATENFKNINETPQKARKEPPSDPFEAWVRPVEKTSDSSGHKQSVPLASPERKVQTKLSQLISSSGSERSSLPERAESRPSRPASRPATAPDPRIFDLSSQITGESPSHHEFNDEVLGTYVYPTNLPIRDYQRNIVRKALIRNLICALPTGLGKTFIASVVMLNWYRWTKDAKIVFVAPTRPLVTQQVESFLQITGVSVNDTCALLLDLVKPNQRAHQWETKRVFFSTPQVVENDIRAGNIDARKIVCLVVDEAHRATGNHSYVTMVRKIAEVNNSVRILALTATPSGKFEGVQEIIKNLLIAHTEIRTDSSLDIRQYMHERKIIQIVTPLSDDQQQLLHLAADSVQEYMSMLKDGGVIYNANPETTHPFQLMDSLRKYMFQPAGKTPIGFRNRSVGMLVHKVLFAINLLKIHGIHPFYERLKALREECDSKKGKAGKFITMLVRKDEFKEALEVSERLIFKDGVRNPEFIGHPKQEHLVDMLGDFFRDHGADSRAIIFVDLRESANEILWLLAQQCPYVEGRLFVGQAKNSQGQKGMTQKEQQSMIQKFKSGEVNVLVATCIAEEGLDIGQVDLIICYDTSSSPIRHIQRMGRTGRKREGNVYMLMTEKEKEKAHMAKLGHRYISDMINKNDPTDDSSLEYAPAVRILPGNSAPQYTEVITSIPAENQVALDAGDILQAMKAEKVATRRKRTAKAAKAAVTPKKRGKRAEPEPEPTEPESAEPEPAELGLPSDASLADTDDSSLEILDARPSRPGGFTSALDLYDAE